VLHTPAEAAAQFAEMVSCGSVALPRPGEGQTGARLDGLARFGREDLCVAKLAEAHADADAILAELHHPMPRKGERWAVWASEGGAARLIAEPTDGSWSLSGLKAWCSGATACTHALVTAQSSEGSRMFSVDLAHAGVTIAATTWAGPGMARADTRSIAFESVEAVAVGDVDEYISRPGFWQGAIGIAAVWFGGAQAIAAPLYAYVAAGKADPHAQAHLGAVDAAMHSASTMLAEAARAIDSDPRADRRIDALRCRAHVERVALEVIERVGRALGPAPYARDSDYAAHMDDLPVYLRQSHAERDLAQLGVAVAAAGVDG
jgi:alkylation response protein AidB-like acyl-CoA dehydrogenase